MTNILQFPSPGPIEKEVDDEELDEYFKAISAKAKQRQEKLAAERLDAARDLVRRWNLKGGKSGTKPRGPA